MRKNPKALFFAYMAIKLAISTTLILTFLCPGEYIEGSKDYPIVPNIKPISLAVDRVYKGDFRDEFEARPISVAIHAEAFAIRDNDSSQATRNNFRSYAINRILAESSASGKHSMLFLLNYIHQFDPADQNQLDDVLNVAAVAKTQLEIEQMAMSEELGRMRSGIEDRVDQLLHRKYNSVEHRTGDLIRVYLQELDMRHDLNKAISVQTEKVSGLRVQAMSAVKGNDVEFLDNGGIATAQENLLILQANYLGVCKNVERLKLQLSELIGATDASEYSDLRNILDLYKNRIEASADQETIIDKFDNILAAAQYVDFKKI